jgi:hypothetical protein
MSIHDTWDDISEDELNESKFKDRESDNYPDGLYTWKIVNFDYFIGKNSGNEHHKWGLEVADGIMQGKFTEDFGNANRIGIKILKEKMYLMTGRIPTIEDVFDTENNCAGPVKRELVGKLVSGKKVTKRKDGTDYVSIYFNSLPVAPYMGRDDAPPPGDHDAPYADDESIPF